MFIARWCVLAAVALGAMAQAADAGRPSLAVSDLEGKGVDPLKTEAMTVGVVRGVRSLDAFQVLSAHDVQQLLAVERTRELLGGESPQAMAPLSEVLGARYLVNGSVTPAGDKLTVDLRLLDTTTGKVLSTRALGPATLETLVKDVPNLAQELLGPLLMQQQGSLLVRSSEEGAEVLVDGTLRGSAPMKAPLELPRGPHRLEVRKDGFISETKPVRVEQGQVTTEEVKLSPSPDYAEAWKLRHGRLRVGAYIATVAAVGSFAGAYLLDRSTDDAYRNQFLPWRTALDESAAPDPKWSANQQDAYAACLSATRAACSDDMSALATRLRTQQYVTAGLLGVGTLATGAAAYLWLTGEDPNRYSRLIATITVGPAPGFALAGRF